MSLQPIELEREPGRFVAAATAMRLLATHQARLTQDNKLRLRRGAAAELEVERPHAPAVACGGHARHGSSAFLRSPLIHSVALHRSRPCV